MKIFIKVKYFNSLKFEKGYLVINNNVYNKESNKICAKKNNLSTQMSIFKNYDVH